MIPPESLTLGLDDYCECLACGYTGLVQAGADCCPNCGIDGELIPTLETDK